MTKLGLVNAVFLFALIRIPAYYQKAELLVIQVDMK